MTAYSRDARKRAAAQRAAQEVEDGMVVGLGTGSTAAFVVEYLAERVRQGLRITCIPTSNVTARHALDLGISLTDFGEHQAIDVTIDGADQVLLSTFDLIKGLGGALLREKIVAKASNRMIVVVDDTKVVTNFGGTTPLPIEIVPFGWQTTLKRLTRTGLTPDLRMHDAKPFETDGGNFIADCAASIIVDPASLEAELSTIVGVVETGLFVGYASDIVIGRADRVEVVKK